MRQEYCTTPTNAGVSLYPVHQLTANIPDLVHLKFHIALARSDGLEKLYLPSNCVYLPDSLCHSNIGTADLGYIRYKVGELQDRVMSLFQRMTTPLFLLRCKQLGLTLTELDLLTIGIINDMFTERENDDFDGWHEVAGQADFDAF